MRIRQVKAQLILDDLVKQRRGLNQPIRALKAPREKINGVWLAEPLLTNEEAEAQAARRSGVK